jgi:uncharacterized protein YvpB
MENIPLIMACDAMTVAMMLRTGRDIEDNGLAEDHPEERVRCAALMREDERTLPR